MAKESLGKVLGQDKRRMDDTQEQLGTIDVSTYFEVPRAVVTNNLGNIRVDFKSITGSTLIWGNDIYGIWGSYEWGDNPTSGFVLGNIVSGLLGENELGIGSQTRVRTIESNLFFDINEDFSSTTYEDSSVTTASGWGTGSLIFGAGVEDVDVNPSIGSTVVDTPVGSFNASWNNISNAFELSNNGSSFASSDSTSSSLNFYDDVVQLVLDGSLVGSNYANGTNIPGGYYPDSYVSYGGSGSTWGLNLYGSTLVDSDFGIAIKYATDPNGYVTDYLHLKDFGFVIENADVIDGLEVDIRHTQSSGIPPGGIGTGQMRVHIAHVKMTAYGSFTTAGSVAQTINLGSDIRLSSTNISGVQYIPTGSFIHLGNGSFSNDGGVNWTGVNPNKAISLDTAGSEVLFRVSDPSGSVEYTDIQFILKQDDY